MNFHCLGTKEENYHTTYFYNVSNRVIKAYSEISSKKREKNRIKTSEKMTKQGKLETTRKSSLVIASYYMYKKSCPILYSNFLYKMGQDFVDIIIPSIEKNSK